MSGFVGPVSLFLQRDEKSHSFFEKESIINDVENFPTPENEATTRSAVTCRQTRNVAAMSSGVAGHPYV